MILKKVEKLNGDFDDDIAGIDVLSCGGGLAYA